MFNFTATIPAVIILSEGENNLEAFYVTTAHRTKILPLYLHLYINLAIATPLDRQQKRDSVGETSKSLYASSD